MKERFKRHVLTAIERPRAVYEYYVSGKSDFPFDMLRYDSAWPVTSGDALSMSTPEGEKRFRVRSVFLRSYREPTIDRWSSFGWSVGLENING